MAVTQQDVDALQAQVSGLNQAITDGVRSVTVGGQTVTYNTTDSLTRARDDAQRRLTAAQAELAGRRMNRRTMLYHAGRGFQ